MTDNAANMKAAFTTQFPREAAGGDNGSISEEPTENEDLWTGNTHDESASSIENERISCFAHTLQFTVGDGLRETKAMSLALSKGTKLTSHLHRSTVYKVS